MLPAAVEEGAAVVPVIDMDPVSVALILVLTPERASVCALTVVVAARLVLVLIVPLALEVVSAAESRTTKANASWI